MQLITRQSVLWKSLSDDTRDLINTGETVLQFVYDYKDRTGIVDYSFCVFSFAKAYEGYLKSLFLKMGFISEHDYYGDDIRIGRILSPYFAESKENIFYKFVIIQMVVAIYLILYGKLGDKVETLFFIIILTILENLTMMKLLKL